MWVDPPGHDIESDRGSGVKGVVAGGAQVVLSDVLSVFRLWSP